jgi:molybdenum cofactor guanylyltransferase
MNAAKDLALSTQPPASPQLCSVTLVVLAGGEGARMGLAKGMLKLEGRPILRYLLDCLTWPGPTLLVTAPGRERPDGHDAFDTEAVDPVSGLGPLQGVLTAVEHTKTSVVVVLPLDMPAMTVEPLTWLVEQLSARPDANGVMTRLGGKVQPFPAAFRVAISSLIRDRMRAGSRSVRTLGSDGHVVVLPAPLAWPQRVWTNLNYPADVERFIASSDLHPDHQ